MERPNFSLNETFFLLEHWAETLVFVENFALILTMEAFMRKLVSVLSRLSFIMF